MLALMLFHMDLNVMSIIGIVLLIGIVKKNAIMMIDFALAAERLEGKSTAEAIFDACMLRFRPIMMTTMAAIFGALPLAFGSGMGSELRRPLGITIVGGLMLSQLITLYTTPVVYLALDRLRLRFRGERQDIDAIGRSNVVRRVTKDHMTMFCHKRLFPVAVAACLLLAGCAVGPKYHPPVPPTPSAANYKESPVNFQDADGWKVASPQDAMLRGKWWEVFNDPDLNALEEQLNINNQNIKESFQNFMEARAVIAQARSQYWPTVGANPSWTRQKSSGNLTNSAQANTGRTSTPFRFLSMSRGLRTSGARSATRFANISTQRRLAPLTLRRSGSPSRPASPNIILKSAARMP